MARYTRILNGGDFIRGEHFRPSKDTEDTVKGSNIQTCVIAGCTIAGGTEDCLDIVRGRDIAVSKTVFINPGKQFITLKGGVQNFLLSANSFFGRAKGWWDFDIVLGGHQIYGWETGPVQGGVIEHCAAFDQWNQPRKLRVLCLHADKPDFRETPHFCLNVPSFIARFIFWLNRKKDV